MPHARRPEFLARRPRDPPGLDSGRKAEFGRSADSNFQISGERPLRKIQTVGMSEKGGERTHPD